MKMDSTCEPALRPNPSTPSPKLSNIPELISDTSSGLKELPPSPASLAIYETSPLSPFQEPESVIFEERTTFSQWIQGMPVGKCLCGVEHTALSVNGLTNLCLERHLYRLLLEIHLAISSDHPVQQLPRSPSLECLPLVDTESNPVVHVIEKMMK